MAARRYIALLRAINLGPRNKVPMADLKRSFEDEGMTDVVTYILTGNVVFSADGSDGRALTAKLERRLQADFGFQIPVFVLTPAALKRAAAANPFDPRGRDNEQHSHLMFLSAAPSAAAKRKLLEMQGSEYRFAIKGKVFYYAYSRADAGSRRRSIDFEKVLGVTGTARTWKVVDKLIELSAPG